MSTPTAAGMIAPSVGITEPTVAPLPRCASGIKARCGKMNGSSLARLACSSVPSSSTDAQLISFLVICSMPASLKGQPKVARCSLAVYRFSMQPRARDLGIPLPGQPAEWNAITDVASVEVGYETLISGEGQ